MSEVLKVMEKFVGDVVSLEQVADATIAHLAAVGMVVLGPDGEPLDVRPALRALGNAAWRWAQEFGPHHLRLSALTYLGNRNISGPLAQKCLDLASEPS